MGESTVRALRKLGVEVRFREAQTCCGQPAFNSGFWPEAKPLARKFLDLFEDADEIVVPSGSCASMIRVFYSELFKDDPADLERVKKIAPKVFELSEYVVDVLGVPGDTGFPENADAPERSVTYHEACHLTRELGASTQARAILKALPGVEVTELDQHLFALVTLLIEWAEVIHSQLDCYMLCIATKSKKHNKSLTLPLRRAV